VSTPTQRSLKLLRDDGYTAEVTEKWNPHAKIRQDLFGFVDVIGIKAGRKPLLVQTTSGSNVAARIAKMSGIPAVQLAIDCGFDVQVHGWRKLASNRNRWTPRIVSLTGDDLCPPSPSGT
jgi:hypothetical protein